MEDKRSLFEPLIKLLNENLASEFIAEFDNLQATDSMDFFTDLTKAQKDSFLKILSNEKIAELFSYLSQEEILTIIEEFPTEKNAQIIENMAPDDAADLLTNIDDEVSNKILLSIKQDKRGKIEKLLPFTEDSAGGIMTSELCALPHNITTKEALISIGRRQVNDPITFVYIIEPHSGILLGTVSLVRLIGTKPEVILKDLVEKNYTWVGVDTDQEEIVQLFRRYNLSVIPVVNEKHQLIGRITADDIIEASVEEADEDISKMAGTPDLIEQETALSSIIRLRLPWLLLTIALALINSAIISRLLDAAGNQIALAIFIPVIMAMGGSTGMQSATIYVRELALGNSEKKLRLIALRETSLGFCMGLACGLFGGIISFFILTMVNTPISELNAILVATVVGVSILNAMTFSSCFGAIIPAILNRIGVDPAVAAGPFITTINDITAVVIYFLTNLLLINALL